MIRALMQAPREVIRALMQALARAMRHTSEDELDRLHVQLAGCGVAALGGTSEPMRARRGQYGWSASYGDVYNLRRRYDYLWERMGQLAAVKDCACEPRMCMHREARVNMGVVSSMAQNESLR